MTLVLGSRIGRYEIRAPLGAGGMGEVYVAHDPNLGRDVAIKVLPTAFSADGDRLTRFEQEARAAGALNHPNVLAVYDVGTDNGVPYIVAELLDGEPLRAKLGRPMTHRRALDYAAQIARGLAAAHDRGIVHRDLKPENVLVTADGRAKIVDFGLAKLALPEELQTSADLLTRPAGTDPGVVLGTVGYMAPEQVRGQKVDHRADVFSFGCILYEMLAGRKAFWKTSGIETLNAILSEEPPDLAASNPAPAPALQRLIVRCLEKNPAARFQSASDLAFALDALSSDSGINASGKTTALTGVPIGATWRKRLPWLVAAIALVANAAALWLLMTRVPVQAPRVRFQVHAPDGGKFQWILGTSSVISPDGQRLVLVITNEGRTQLFVRGLDTPEPKPLDGTVGASNPFWSPDGRSLGFFADGKLKRIEMSGGAPQTICDAPSGLSSWGRDGTILFSQGGRILRVPASGGNPVPAATPDPARHEAAYDYPYFLPDGRHFLYGVWNAGPDRELRVGTLGSAAANQLLKVRSRAVYVPPGYLLFVREGTLLAQPFDSRTLTVGGDPVAVAEDLVYFQETAMADISASNDGMLAYLSGTSVTRLKWFSRDGAEQAVVGAPADYNHPRLSLDGQRLAVNIVDPRTASTDVWLVDLSRGASSRFTFDSGVEWFPVWSPDAKRIAFAANGSGGRIPSLYVKGLADAGSGDALVPPGGEVQFPWDWAQTPAGEFILYPDRTPTTGTDLMVLPLQGERKPRPWLRTRFDESDARVSPDGRWVAYVSTESGRREVYVRAFDGAGETIQVSTAGGVTPRWRRDGRELYYLAPNGNMTMVTVRDGAGFHVGNPAHLFHVELAHDDFGQYDVSADGQRFLVNTAAASRAPAVTVDVNWTAGLKR